MKNKFRIDGNEAIVTVKYKRKELETIISVCDLPLMQAHNGTWHAFFNKKQETFYVYKDFKLNGKKRTVYLHRIIMDEPIKRQVDHINGDTLDNRRDNLRSVKQFENIQNRIRQRKDSKSGVTGVQWNEQRKRWVSQITHEKKTYRIGEYENKQDAIDAYRLARAKLMPFSKEAREIDGYKLQNRLDELTIYKPNKGNKLGVKHVYYQPNLKSPYIVSKRKNGKIIFWKSFRTLEEAKIVAKQVEDLYNTDTFKFAVTTK